MKSKLKIILFIFISSLFFSCSYLSQFQKDARKGTVYIQLPGAGSDDSGRALGITEQKLRAKASYLIYNITVKDGEEIIEQREAKGGSRIELYMEAGKYVLDAIAYDLEDTGKEYPLFTGSVDIEVKAETITSVTMRMKRLVHADFERKSKGEYSWNDSSKKYFWDGQVLDYCDGFDKVIKKGDCAAVTFKGKANTTFKGTFYCALGKENYGYATPIAIDSKQVSFKAGENVELSFELIAEGTTSSKEELAFCLFYYSDEFNESMSFNENSIEFNFEPDFSTVNPITVSVVLPEYKEGNISVSKANAENGYKFTCVEDELSNKNIKLVSYNWILTLADEEKTVSTENTFTLTNTALSTYKNGAYELSIVAYDEQGNMYAATASIIVYNANQSPVENVKEGFDIEVIFPSQQTDALSIEEKTVEQGTMFTCDSQKLSGVSLVSYNWVLSAAGSDVSVSTQRSYTFTKEAAAKLSNGVYALSLTAYDSKGTMYAAVVYINVSNKDGELIQDVPEGNTVSVNLPTFSSGDYSIYAASTEEGGVLYTIKDGTGKVINSFDLCVWTLDDEKVSTKASFELTAEKKASLGSGIHELSVFIKKNGVYACDTKYITK